MNEALLLSIIAGGFTVAFMHAAIPTHWLPFVVTARAQGWDRPKTLGIVTLAGGGHVLFTTLLGVAIVWFGMKVDRLTGSVFPLIAAAVLIGFGLYYLLGQHRHHPHMHLPGAEHDHHHHGHHGHDDPPVHVHKQVSDRTAIGGLLVLLTFSPCEGFLPIYVSAVRLSWSGFLISSAVLAAATLASMVLFTYITMSGMKRFKFHTIERYENIILGTVLCLLGVAVLFVES